MLVELPNGDWLNPENVAEVKYMEPLQEYDISHRITIVTSGGMYFSVPFETEQKAYEWRRTFGQQVNATLLLAAQTKSERGGDGTP